MIDVFDEIRYTVKQKNAIGEVREVMLFSTLLSNK
jgi:hypothetical protein